MQKFHFEDNILTFKIQYVFSGIGGKLYLLPKLNTCTDEMRVKTSAQRGHTDGDVSVRHTSVSHPTL